MDQLGKTGVIPPPEKPELSTTRGVVSSPHAQHIRRQASAETTQDWVLLGHGEKDGRRCGSLPHKTPPFYSSQISLKRKEKNNVRMNTQHSCTALSQSSVVDCITQWVGVCVSSPTHTQWWEVKDCFSGCTENHFEWKKLRLADIGKFCNTLHVTPQSCLITTVMQLFTISDRLLQVSLKSG